MINSFNKEIINDIILGRGVVLILFGEGFLGIFFFRIDALYEEI